MSMIVYPLGKVCEWDQKIHDYASPMCRPRVLRHPFLLLGLLPLISPKLSAVTSFGSKRPNVANQHQPRESPSPCSSSCKLFFIAIDVSFAFSRWRRAASVAAYTPSSRFLERNDRLTFDLVDFAIDMHVGGKGGFYVVIFLLSHLIYFRSMKIYMLSHRSRGHSTAACRSTLMSFQEFLDLQHSYVAITPASTATASRT